MEAIMPKHARKSSSEGYEVGYGRPPSSGKWKPGESANPGGKKKGTKNRATVLNEIMARKLTVTEHGKTRKITVLEGLLLKCLDPALKGNLKAIAYLIDQHEQSQTKEAKRKANRVVMPRITDESTLQELADAYAMSIRADKLGLEKIEEGNVDEDDG
jgi:hypothetical protein